jgi:hypothetical protein
MAKKKRTANTPPNARQRDMHGKDGNQCTSKKTGTAKAHAFAVHRNYVVRHDDQHSKRAFAVHSTLCRAQNSFFKFFYFYFILFNTYVYFSISFIFC